MEMERINEDTIKVLIMPEDLEERGINFLELISNHARIEQFFYSILERWTWRTNSRNLIPSLSMSSHPIEASNSTLAVAVVMA